MLLSNLYDVENLLSLKMVRCGLECIIKAVEIK